MDKSILFRGKRKSNGSWAYGYYAAIKDQHCILTQSPLGLLHVEVELGTIGRFTGLLDKNGKQIFEFDKVKVFIHNEVIIKYHNGGFGYFTAIKYFISLSGNDHFKWKNNQSEHIEVIEF